MTTDWKPGDVAMVNIAPDCEVQATFYDTGRERGWYRGEGLADQHYIALESDVPARRLVVIDPEDREAAQRLVDLYTSEGAGRQLGTLEALSWALREFANPKPPRPDEPMGLGAVVVDTDDRLWIHDPTATGTHHWHSRGVGRTWHNIPAVEVLSRGYEQGGNEPLADWERDLLNGSKP